MKTPAEINKKYKEQKKKEKLKAKELERKEKSKQKKLKVKERKDNRKAKAVYNRNIKKWRKENVTIAKMIAKIRDNYTCQKCGKTKDIHGSHIINEARDHRLACDPYNIKALCYTCHLQRWHKNPLEASDWFEEKRPGRREILQQRSIEYSKMGSIEYEWIENQNRNLKKEYKEISGKDWE